MAGEKFTGLVSKISKLIRGYTGGLSFVGTLSRTGKAVYDITKGGILDFAGATSNLLNWARTKTGSISFLWQGGITNIAKNFLRTFTGALSSSGILTKALNLARTLTGVLDFIGTLNKAFSVTYEGALSFGGEILREMGQALTGVLSSAGDLTRNIQLSKLYEGGLSFLGTVIKDIETATQKFITKVGILSFSKTLSGEKGGFREYLGDLSFTSVFTQLDIYLKRFTPAVLSFAGNLTREIGTGIATRTGLLSLTGIISHIISYGGTTIATITGILSFSGAISSTTQRFHKFFGTLTRIIRVTKSYTGILSFAGSASRLILGRVYTAAGVLSFSGLIDYLEAPHASYVGTYISSLSSSGLISRLFGLGRTRQGVLSFGGTVTSDVIIEILYFGPENP